MAGGDTELCGFLDAKLPGSRCMSQRVRKRSLAAWKVWRRHWCSVRKMGPGLGVEIQLDCGISSGGAVVPNERDNSIKVPTESLICRTDSRTKQFAFGIFPPNERKPLLYLCGISETETQRWMADLRNFLKPRKHRFMEGAYDISIVDNAHSRAAGLTGLHGDLVASRSGVFIKDPNSGSIIENFDWTEMRQFHLSTSGRPEDVKRICVIHTTNKFRNGVGELEIFCLTASKLLQDLVTQGRGPKMRHVTQRPLSLSEGDLRLSIHNDDSSPCFPVLKSKVASSLINAGLGLLLASRTSSETKLLQEMADRRRDVVQSTSGKNVDSINRGRAIDNVYQSEPASVANLFTTCNAKIDEQSTRRISNISVASGIYEEINESVEITKNPRKHSNIYEVPDELFLRDIEVLRTPPPLPPRKRCGSASDSMRNCSTSDDGLESDCGTRSATPSVQEDAPSFSDDKIFTPGNCEFFDNSDYVPMSPRVNDITTKQLPTDQKRDDDVYMVMR